MGPLVPGLQPLSTAINTAPTPTRVVRKPAAGLVTRRFGRQRQDNIAMWTATAHHRYRPREPSLPGLMLKTSLRTRPHLGRELGRTWLD